MTNKTVKVHVDGVGEYDIDIKTSLIAYGCLIYISDCKTRVHLVDPNRDSMIRFVLPESGSETIKHIGLIYDQECGIIPIITMSDDKAYYYTDDLYVIQLPNDIVHMSSSGNGYGISCVDNRSFVIKINPHNSNKCILETKPKAAVDKIANYYTRGIAFLKQNNVQITITPQNHRELKVVQLSVEV